MRITMPRKARAVVARAILLVAIVAGAPCAAADRLVVALSDPAKPAALDAALVVGSIQVVAGSAGEVVIETSMRSVDGDGDRRSGRPETRAQRRLEREPGLRRIPNPARGVTAEEDGNEVTVRGGIPGSVDLRISVPAASSVKLSTVSGGALEVEGVTGELELHNTNGAIRVRGARGPVTANTVNGAVEVVLAPGSVPGPMAFSTLNGDVELTLPPRAGVDLRVRTDHGDIYSDFDVELSPQATRVENGETGRGRYRVSLAKELTGAVNGGGPEVYLKSFNGDIVLRRGGS